MRFRTIVTAALLIPVVAGAQRRLGGGRIGGRAMPPVELPPTASVVAREMSFVRFPISSESYTFINYMNGPAAGPSGVTASGSMGFGTRLDYRFTSHASGTLDITQTFIGGPMAVSTLELGTRLRPLANMEEKLRPFFDARVGYSFASESYYNGPSSVSPTVGFVTRYGQGLGIVGGGGADFKLTQTIALQSGLWVARNQMKGIQSNGNYYQPSAQTSGTYYLTTTRFALGIKWNPGRWVPQGVVRN